MARPGNVIDLPDAGAVAILYEDRSALALDKPAGWLIAPEKWSHTRRNLHRALMSGIAEGAFWARSRRLKFLRFVHRLDADTSGVLLLVKSLGAVRAYSELFQRRSVEKVYLAIVSGSPKSERWTCNLALTSELDREGRIRVRKGGESAETQFRVVGKGPNGTLVEARPITGRTHQIRVHLAESGCPIVGDALYGTCGPRMAERGLGLRAVKLGYPDPFVRRWVEIEAPSDDFLRRFGFAPTVLGKE